MQQVLIVEDHLETREWLVSIVNRVLKNPDIVQSGTLEQAFRILPDIMPSLALIDLSLPDGSGIDLLCRLRSERSEAYLVVCSIFDDDRHLFNALKAGAGGYLLKDQPTHSMIESLTGILEGKPPLSPTIARRILRHFHKEQDENEAYSNKNLSDGQTASLLDKPLSEREEQVLQLLAKGMGRADIARLLGMSANTAASHTKSIYRKLNVSGRAEATLRAVQMGVVPGASDF
ncbi:response regulator transcription factor [Marinobacter sp. HL-58]|uniref:LuxR C-terminal-related transcriptional regulator n=1 Tax=Marinobacter sp. HL-58 TaxID=1479237 RepID=UPI00047FB98D|nr:response regulator transcription factor [Marinobacter sp. HL-58]KPP97819.1 MAG: two-component signal transduction system LuxR family response regulator [Marinobacter sp. HL-58]